MLAVQPKALAHKGGIALGRVALEVWPEIVADLGDVVFHIGKADTGGDAVAQRHIGELRLRFAGCLGIGGQGSLLLGRRCGLLLLHFCCFGGSKCRHGQQHKRCCCGQKAGKFFVFHCDSFFPEWLHLCGTAVVSMIRWKVKIVN